MSSKDQLKIICRTIGTPSTLDRSFISSDQSNNYLDFVCEHRHKNKLEKMFPTATPDALDLLNGLLEFNPHFRLSAKEALQNPLFDQIRQKHFEQDCPIKINQKIFSEGAYDYIKFEDTMFTMKDYKKMLIHEQRKVRKCSYMYKV